MTSPAFDVVQIPFDRLHSASWNANRVPKDVLAKIRRSLREFGPVENSVVRSLPQPCPYCNQATEETHYEIISGNHRSLIYRDEGFPTMPCIVRDLDDAHARMLAQVLNRTRGADDPDAYRMLLEDVIADLDIEEIVSFLPETEESIRRIIADVPEAGDEPSYDDPTLWGVIIECDNEDAQADLIGRMTEEGYTCRALML